MRHRPLFSIVHPTARPDGWQKACNLWLKNATRPDEVEYILAVDKQWGFVPSDERLKSPSRDAFGQLLDKVTWNEGRKCIVDNANTGCAAATGGIIVIIADDVFPPEGWDAQIRQALELSGHWWADDLVIKVSVNPAHDPNLMLLPFFSRARYERVGYGMFPEYEGMYADNDFTEHVALDAQMGRTTIVDARHVIFRHDHPTLDPKVGVDPVYAHQNRPESYAFGLPILKERRRTKFAGPYPYELGMLRPSVPGFSFKASGQTIVACCLPGETFSHDYVVGWTNLFGHLIGRQFQVNPHFCHTSNVYVTRQELAESVQQVTPHADYILWLDDDNLLTPPQFDMLLNDLEEHPEIDMVVGWCWIHNPNNPPEHQWFASCGKTPKDESMMYQAMTAMELFAKSVELEEIQGTGFPCVLMRYGVLEKIGPRPFRPIVSDKLQYGFSSEDAAFCKRAVNAGIRMFVDKRVRVPHLKQRAIEPSFVQLMPKALAESAPLAVGAD